MTGTDNDTRRTQNVRTGGRSAGVVDRVLRATAEELGRIGYDAMRVEDVAELAGVNKTTIYRRWSTKAELVIAAVMEEQGVRPAPIDTGAVRDDLRASLLASRSLDAAGRGMLRVVQMERKVPAVEALARRFRRTLRRLRIEMVQRGIERGELPADADAALIVDLVSAPVQQAMLFDESLNGRDIDRIVDLVLAGAMASASPKRPGKAPRKSMRKKKRTRAS
jgi:AcrR family transcriptional regulator